jgi:hypothetical protein
MSAESTRVPAQLSRGRIAFRHWRWERPFYAGVLTILAGVPIGYLPYNNVTFGQLTVRMATTAGAGSLIIGVLLVVLGLTMWFQSAVRIFAGVATILLGLVSIPVSNFGGLVIGFLLALVGGGMAVAWVPGTPAADEPGEKAELPDAGPLPAGDGADGAGDREDLAPALPAQPAGPFEVPEPVHSGARPDDDTTEENGRNRAG